MRACAIALLGALCACSGNEGLAPLGVELDAGVDAGGGGGPQHDAGVKRTVEQRNPFGDVAVRDNLLWDGDFEWETAFADQYGWLAGPPYTAYVLPTIAVGATCKSGVKCAVVAPGKGLVGLGVASTAGVGLVVSAMAKPTAPDTCAALRVVVTTAFTTTLLGDDEEIPPPEKPRADGWCHFFGKTSKRTQKLALYVVNQGAGDVIFDDAAVTIDPGTLRALPGEGPALSRAVEPALAARLAEARRDTLGLVGPHDPPPNAARRAFEAWKKTPREGRR